MAGKNWMAGAVKPANKGKFRKKAKAAGESTAEYAADVTKPGSKASAKTKKQANLAKIFAKFRP